MTCLPFHEPPIPVEATWFNGSATISVTFDQPLTADELDPSNWSFSPSGGQMIVAAQAIGPTVELTINSAPLTVSTVSYSPPPFDVVASDSGLAAEAFSDFPVTTV